ISNDKGNFLLATDFHNNKIDVFDKNFDKVTLGQNGWGTFTDPNEPAGYAPFGVKEVNIGGTNVILVSYAKQDAAGHDDVAGVGNGFMNEFDTSGHFIRRFATGSSVGGTVPLDSPIAMTVAPAGFGPNGKFGGALLISNFGDSQVSAFDLKTGQFLGQLSDAQGNPLTLNGGVGGSGSKGLWGIAFGNGQGGTDPNTLYFAAGINAENDGLFGKVTMSDDPSRGSAAMSSSVSSGTQQPAVASLFANQSTAMTPAMMPSSNGMMMSSNGMMPSVSSGEISMIDQVFQELNAELAMLEPRIVAIDPQLRSIVQMYNSASETLETDIAGHAIGGLPNTL
ncbi:MAG: TIGR03118 family protein, partial [Gemmataceae bacterium]